MFRRSWRWWSISLQNDLELTISERICVFDFCRTSSRLLFFLDPPGIWLSVLRRKGLDLALGVFCDQELSSGTFLTMRISKSTCKLLLQVPLRIQILFLMFGYFSSHLFAQLDVGVNLPPNLDFLWPNPSKNSRGNFLDTFYGFNFVINDFCAVLLPYRAW